MTIGIGVLCSSNPRPNPIRPDGLILLADTMGSTDYDSTAELHKLCPEPDQNLFFACAGDIAFCNDVGSLVKDNVSKLPSRTHGPIWDAINRAVHEALMARFQWDILRPKYMFAPGIVFDSQRDNVTEEWQQYHPSLQMLIGTFHQDGRALLYLVHRYEGSFGWVHLCQFPGHMAIGSGSYNAEFWLKFRNQQLGLSPKHSAYHGFEAKTMASNAPTVNKNTDMVLAFANRHYVLTDERPEAEGCPISLLEMVEMYKKHGPQDANDLGHSMPRAISGRSCYRS